MRLEKYIPVVIILSLVLWSFYSDLSLSGLAVKRIAHAGGEFEGKTFTNSLEALNLNVKKGFKYFELDFIFTKDEYLICLHDWEESFERSFGFQTENRLSLESFQSLNQENLHYEKCTLESLAQWMEKNPKTFIITDVKENNLKALKIISERIPNFEKRIIPQIYFPQNYNSVKEMGYQQIIWALYKYEGNNETVLNWTAKFKGPFAITMPKEMAKSDLPAKLLEKGIYTFAHTINNETEEKELIEKFKVTGIYTDSLYPLKTDFSI